MITLQMDQLSRKEAYKVLSGSVVPRPIAFITSLSKEEIVNAAPFSFFNVISGHPPLIAVSIGRRQGEMKDTAKHIIDREEFVVHVSDEAMIEDINETAATLPEEESELTRTGLHQVKSSVVSVPGIKEARIRFECQLEKHLTFQNDEGEITVDHIIGRVLSYDARHYFWSSHDFSRSRHLSLTQKSERTGHCFRWRHIFGFWMVYRHDHHL